MEKWVWEAAQSLAGDQDKQMTDGTQGWAAATAPGACPIPAPGTPGTHLGDGDRVPRGGDVINQQLAEWGN